MKENEITLISDSIIKLMKQEKYELPFNYGNFKNTKINSGISRNFINRNFKTIGKQKFDFIGINYNQTKSGFDMNDNALAIHLLRNRNIFNTLKNINTYADMDQEIIKKSSKNVKGGVIPLLYEKKFLIENKDILGSSYNFWFYHSLYMEAIDISKKKRDFNDMKRLYAILLMFENKDNDFIIDEKIITSHESIDKLLEENGYILKKVIKTM